MNMWEVDTSIHLINFSEEVHTMKGSSQKSKVVTGKTPSYEYFPFYLL